MNSPDPLEASDWLKPSWRGSTSVWRATVCCFQHHAQTREWGRSRRGADNQGMVVKQVFGSQDDTPQRMLKAATALFAERGVEKASLRELTQLAEVNLAAVNYHFGSKDALVEAVFEDLARRVNAMRLRNLQVVLDAADAQAARPDLEAILNTFIEPYLGPDTVAESALLAQLVLKHRLAPSAMTTRIIKRHFDPMAKRYVAAFVAACPAVDPSEFYWRYMFMAGAVILTSTDRRRSNRVERISDGAFSATDPQALRAALMRFLRGGMAAR